MGLFLGFLRVGLSVSISAPAAFAVAAAVNYLLCVLILFRHKARWSSLKEVSIYILVVCLVAMIDLWMISGFIQWGLSAALSKAVATLIGLFLNFAGRRCFVFPEPASGPWRPQENHLNVD